MRKVTNLLATREGVRKIRIRFGADEGLLCADGAVGTATLNFAGDESNQLSFVLHDTGFSSSWFVYRLQAPILQIKGTSRGVELIDGRGIVAAHVRRRWRPLRLFAPWLPRRSTCRNETEVLYHDRTNCAGHIVDEDWVVVSRVHDYRSPTDVKIRAREFAAIVAFAVFEVAS